MLFRLLVLGDVGKNRDVMRNFAAIIFHRIDRQQFGKDFAILAAIPHLTVPSPCFQQVSPHGMIKPGVVPSGIQYLRCLADYIFCGIAGNLAKSCVDRNDKVIAVRDKNGIR